MDSKVVTKPDGFKAGEKLEAASPSAPVIARRVQIDRSISANMYVAELSHVRLADPFPLRRTVRKSLVPNDPSDLPNYDYKSVFYDVYQAGDRVHLSGPPLDNLLSHTKACDFLIDGTLVNDRLTLGAIMRTQKSWISDIGVGARRLQIQGASLRADIPVRHAGTDTFRDRNVIFTMSKNNDLDWVSDWARYYVKRHGVNAVLIYDNCSHLYSVYEVLERLRNVPGLKAAVVVDWPYLYGPQTKGIGPLGNFSQATMFEHARRRFLSAANVVVNADIDELVQTPRSETIVGLTMQQEVGLRFPGRWIEAHTVSEDCGGKLQFTDFGYYDPQTCRSDAKWAVKPSAVPDAAQWRTHWLQDLELPEVKGVHHAHFKGINTNWQYNRSSGDAPLSSSAKLDMDMIASVKEALS